MIEEADVAEVILAVTCGNPECSNFGEEINTITVPNSPADVDMLFESYGNGGEDAEDFCEECHQLGILEDGQ